MTCRFQQEALGQSSMIVDAASKPALDIWIGRELKRAYDPALGERLPDDLMRLVEMFPRGC